MELMYKKKFEYINKGLYTFVRNNDIIIIGGYEQPTYILLSIMCKLLRKSYVIFFDGISKNRLYNNEKIL